MRLSPDDTPLRSCGVRLRCGSTAIVSRSATGRSRITGPGIYALSIPGRDTINPARAIRITSYITPAATRTTPNPSRITPPPT